MSAAVSTTVGVLLGAPNADADRQQRDRQRAAQCNQHGFSPESRAAASGRWCSSRDCANDDGRRHVTRSLRADELEVRLGRLSVRAVCGGYSMHARRQSDAQLAVPLLTLAVPKTLAPSLNVTTPPGLGFSVLAVSAMGCAGLAGFIDDETVVGNCPCLP